MISEEELVALVGALYEAALDDELWPKVLEQIADATGTVQAAIASADREANIISVIAPRVDPGLLASWQDDWAYRDPFFLRAILRPPGGVYTLESLIAREEFAASEVFNMIWRKANCSLATAAANLIADDKFCVLIGISNPRGSDFLTGEQLQLFEIISRHCNRAVRICRKLWQLDLAKLAAQPRLEALAQGVMLVDVRGRVAAANAVAKEMLDAREGLFLCQGRLAFCGSGDILHRFAVSSARAPPALGGAGGKIIVPRAPPKPPLDVFVAPLVSRARLMDVPWTGFGSPVAVVTVRDPDREQRRLEEKLRRRFGFTQAEAAFAAQILKGDGRRAAAQRCEITDGTAKSHLAHIFEKTGTSRQAELVRFLLGCVNAPEGEASEP
jgi:DNA-binding CsgD family transcriptional regulator